MKSLVIGGTSLTGKCMIEYLRRQGHTVIATKLPKESLPLRAENTCVENLDLLEPLSIIEVLRKYQPDYIFNFAAQNSVGYAWSNPGATVDVNINGSLNLFDAIRQLNCQPIALLVGSGEEYGRTGFSQIPMKETGNLYPSNIFAATKACQTMMAQIYHRAYDMHLIVARTFNDIGPGQSSQFSISDFCRQAVLIEMGQQEPVISVGNLNVQRDFTDIRDQVRAFWLLAQKGKAGEVYNVGRGHAMSIRNTLAIIQEQMKTEAVIRVDSTRIRPLDTPKIEADIQKLQQDTGWSAEITMQQSIADMIDYWRKMV